MLSQHDINDEPTTAEALMVAISAHVVEDKMRFFEPRGLQCRYWPASTLVA
jgi:hypothetical protein